eukprot:gnl/TRDRNA2_/TRDRNA2_173681_c0_seq4.p3 gnl/TRDRNA2_/TRDRNA2_173681_c0~~gnl/TRDRNA2_/TRDRNA2_173681_c0_seq4.p3  ORF type:complete len:122 (+),score=30.72 gnl/TRDRNA2_/TRDRNA2_173681_c0_seq4:142-507(+)
MLTSAAEQRLRKFGAQHVANTVWACARAVRKDERLIEMLAESAVQQVSEFKPQEMANAIWAFATIGYRDEMLLAAFARAVQRRMEDLSSQPEAVSMTLWALSQHGSLQDAWSVFDHVKKNM